MLYFYLKIVPLKYMVFYRNYFVTREYIYAYPKLTCELTNTHTLSFFWRILKHYVKFSQRWMKVYEFHDCKPCMKKNTLPIYIVYGNRAIIFLGYWDLFVLFCFAFNLLFQNLTNSLSIMHFYFLNIHSTLYKLKFLYLNKNLLIAIYFG